MFLSVICILSEHSYTCNPDADVCACGMDLFSHRFLLRSALLFSTSVLLLDPGYLVFSLVRVFDLMVVAL